MPRVHCFGQIVRDLCLVALVCLVVQTARADEPAATPPETAPEAPQAKPLHERIDESVEALSPGPVAPLASDAEFLRRAYLDLNGTIPDAGTARAFLDDTDPGKRTALIERLLADPRFARHMQHTFGVMWLERRRGVTPGKGVTDAEWEEYLRRSFAENKPLDQLVREILSADGADPALRPAAKFYLDRDGEPNLLARDVGRLFFGRDMQCAQCHDHPLVDDYFQSEYYGLLAFVNRGTLFTDTKDENKLYYAELAEGEVNFKSVFTGNERDRVLPGLPDGGPVAEPTLAKAEQYVVAPDKEVRPVPKYSRRAQLAQLATSGTSEAFNRNLANRLWAHMLGQGIVHPLDMHHSANPPLNSELLSLLADELVTMKYDLREFLRQVALSRAYQRSSIEPETNEPRSESVAAVAEWRGELDRVASGLPSLEDTVASSDIAQDEAYEAYSAATAARAEIEKKRAEIKKSSDELSAALSAAIKEVATKEDIVKSLVAASTAAEAAAAKLPEDKALAEATGTFKTRTTETEAALTTARATVAEKTPQVQAASVQLAEIDSTLPASTAEVTAKTAALATAEAAAQQANKALFAAKTLQNELTQRIADAEQSTAYQALLAKATEAQAAVASAEQQLASVQQQAMAADAIALAETATAAARVKAAADDDAAQKTWGELVEHSSERFTLTALKGLSPEQLTWATMQALGLVDVQKAALLPEAQKLVDADGEMSPENKALALEKQIEELVNQKLAANIAQFVSLFGQQPGQAPTFQATVHQALFLANGGTLSGWLAPQPGNLTERLIKLEDPQAVAEELYLSVFTRRPDADEAASVAEYWQSAAADRPAAVREMVWSLVTSSEFRFNH